MQHRRTLRPEREMEANIDYEHLKWHDNFLIPAMQTALIRAL